MICIKKGAPVGNNDEYRVLIILTLELGRFGSIWMVEWEKEDKDASCVNSLSTRSIFRPTLPSVTCSNR